jgi:hypothetical protein
MLACGTSSTSLLRHRSIPIQLRLAALYLMHHRLFQQTLFRHGQKCDAYGAMTHYLKIMKKIDKEKTRQVIPAYYNHKPPLPALKDEFNKAGLV